MKPGMSLIKHYLQFKDFRAEEYAYLFERAAIIKKRFKNYEKYTPLVDRTLAMIFEKASTRPRVSFEAGMYQMGGSVVRFTTEPPIWYMPASKLTRVRVEAFSKIIASVRSTSGWCRS